jgi:hypothetical protein
MWRLEKKAKTGNDARGNECSRGGVDIASDPTALGFALDLKGCNRYGCANTTRC